MRRNKPEVQGESKEEQLDKKSSNLASSIEQWFNRDLVAKQPEIPQAEYQAALDLRKTADDLLLEIDSTFDPIIKLAHQSHKLAIKTKKDKSQRLIDAKELLDKVIVRYLDEKRERERLERERLELEAKREQEEQRQLTAATLIENGKEEEAVTLLEMELPAPVVAALPVERESSEAWTKELYSCEVTSFALLLKAVIDGNVHPNAIMPNQVWLNDRAREFKDEFNLPGCKLVKKSSAPVLKK